jgi:hypothetical protein
MNDSYMGVSMGNRQPLRRPPPNPLKLSEFVEIFTLIIWVTGTSPIRLSPIGHSPLAKIQRYIGETPLHFRQLSKFRITCWRKYSGLSPVVMNLFKHSLRMNLTHN